MGVMLPKSMNKEDQAEYEKFQPRLVKTGRMEAVAYPQGKVFEAAKASAGGVLSRPP